MTYFGRVTTLLDPSNMSAFGVSETAELTPVIQGDFSYGINTQIWATPVVSGTGATVDTNLSRLRIQSGTAAAGYAYIQSRRPVRYRAGQGQVARFTPLFNSIGLATNIQLWGMGSIVTNLPYDGYFFGYNGTSFGIVHYNRGTPTWYAQSVWNVDKVDGSAGTTFNYNPSFGTPVTIKYPYLGFGNIEFFIQNPNDGRWVLVHIIKYSNAVNTTQVSNPSLFYTGFTLNSGNTTNATMYCGSVGAFISGMRSFVGNPKWAIDNNKATITTETCLVNLRNATTYNGVPNRGLIRLNSISIVSSLNSANSTSIAVFRLKIGATIGGSPTYTPINGSTADSGATLTSANSIASFDVAGTTVAGGTYIYNISCVNQNSMIIDVTPFDIFVAPGEILTCSGFATASSALGISLNWTEDV